MTNFCLFQLLTEDSEEVFINVFEISSIVKHKTIENASAIHMTNGHCYTDLRPPTKLADYVAQASLHLILSVYDKED